APGDARAAVGRRPPRGGRLSGHVNLALHDFGGTGPDVLLLHGGADNLETWRDLVPRLRRRFRLVAYDARGHGQSPTPAHASVEDLVSDVTAVADELELGRPLLLGHSMGGVNALLAAASERFAGVVALDGVPRWWSRPDLTVEDLVEIGRSRGLGWSGTQEELDRQAASLGRDSRHGELIRAIFRRNHEPDGSGLLRRKPDPSYALALAQIYQGPESGLTKEKVEEARCPVVLLCSEQWVTGAAARRALAELSRAEVVFLDTSHYVHWDDPDEVVRRVEAIA
ncbi:MAG: alpha/beta hydrolase, partial [Actinomycetota bacterium]|nr:alpha/beta hydrolase [Actinomycetota bacterium]